MSVLLFGPPQIKRGNEHISLQRRKDLALLIYLIVTSQPHSRDTLATLLWQDQNQTDARSNLRKSLSRLKILLGETSILVSQDRVSLNPNLSIHADIAQFDARIHQVREHKHAGNGSGARLCKECLGALEEAAHLYQADFLQGFGVSDSSVFEEWQFFQTEHLRKHLAEILEILTHQYIQEEDYNTAIEHCRRGLALDRLHEPAHRQLMRLYALNGQQTAALRQFDECARLLKDELDAEPEPETLQLYEAIKKKKYPVPQETQKIIQPQSEHKKKSKSSPILQQKSGHNLPPQPTPFVGREKELNDITRVLGEPSCRLLTLLGPGGSGKTRLALQAASVLSENVSEPFKDGVWFIPLAPVMEPQSIVSAILEELKITGYVNGIDVRQKLLSYVHERQMLLVLDNFEHLLNDESVKLVSDILSTGPQSKILLTSRERLNAEGEYIFRVEGLETPLDGTLPSKPESDSIPPAFSALQLFEQCAIRVQPSFRITDENYRPIVQICQNVQGMPLAIELAAAWLEVFSLEEINNEIRRSLDFLQSNWRDLPDRQRSLRAVFDSSWSLLDKTTRPVIKALSVFRSSFTREAAQAISGVSARTLLDLTHKSWIQRLSNGRYQIHELLRQFAFEKLESEQATYQVVMKQYGNYYAAYAARLWEDMRGANQQRAFSGMETEFDLIHVAWSWLVSAGEMETAVQNILPLLFHYAELRGKSDTLLHMLDLALASLAASGSGQDAQIHEHEIILRSAKGAFFQDGFPLRYNFPPDLIFPIDQASIRRAWTLAQKQESFHKLGLWGILLCYVYGRILQHDEGVRQLKRVIPFFERTGQTWELATGYLHLLKLLIPNAAYGSRHRKQLAGYLSHAQDIFTSLGDAISTGHILILWGDLKYQEQDIEGAIKQWQLARHSFLNTGEWAAATHMSWQLSDVYLLLGDFPKAFDGYSEIAATYHEHGLRIQEVSALSKESYEKARYGDIREALEIRRTCLDIIQETGPTYQIAWNDWEMGELLRLMGNPEAASEWYERAYQIFDREQDNIGRCYYFRGMGDIALGKKNYEAARNHFSTSVGLAKSANHTWMICYSLSKLARAQVELQDVLSAKRNLRSAFQYGVKTLDKGIMLLALVEYAEFCAKLGRHARAVELGALVHDHFASWHETKKQAATLLDRARKSLPRQQFNEAKKNGRSLDVWQTITGLIKSNETPVGKSSKLSRSNELMKA